MSKFECLSNTSTQLGECPRWDEVEKKLYWVDILAPAIHVFSPDTGQQQTLQVAEHIGCFSLVNDGDDAKFIAGMRSGIWLLGADGKQLRKLADNPEDQAHSRFNDGRCDSQGRFWAGTLDEPKAGGKAHLYRFDASGLKSMDGGLLTSNGAAFSPDQRWMYHSDTPKFTIYRHAYDEATGTLGEREDWVRFTPTESDRGRPDGAAVDSQGYYWSALYEGGRVVRISPEGKIVETYPLPARCPTMCAFGGDDLRTLYVTTARAGRPETELQQYPQSGSVFAMQVAIPGLPERRFGQ
ncbi:SMP-30/gluconolactonase/LRE family protein [Glaciimonas soli]|uniref:SMP-30/gluconolactonase/LRE family protein n=1 Tax=Glaciimonas soli TaxID=2590999 RepID=A0A843YUS5_9BURK|nr:SMP-30/gluconolactonase/LRE family protein [Glaciimonas soli]MQR00376.1 SMP-30/gluconolactonase/LRE family protein [Glaciimonas soli]